MVDVAETEVEALVGEEEVGEALAEDLLHPEDPTELLVNTVRCRKCYVHFVIPWTIPS